MENNKTIIENHYKEINNKIKNTKYVILNCENAYAVDTKYGTKLFVKFNKSVISKNAQEIDTVKTDYFFNIKQAFICNSKQTYSPNEDKTIEHDINICSVKLFTTYAQWMKENKDFHFEGVLESVVTEEGEELEINEL